MDVVTAGVEETDSRQGFSATVQALDWHSLCPVRLGPKKEVHEKRPLDHEKKPIENLEVEDSHPMSWLARVRFGSCLA